MNARVLERMSLKYRRWVYVQRDESEHKAMYDEFEQHEALLEAKRHELHEAMVETVQSELHTWQRASPGERLELCPCDRIPIF
jgi:hypothetical protein